MQIPTIGIRTNTSLEKMKRASSWSSVVFFQGSNYLLINTFVTFSTTKIRISKLYSNILIMDIL